MGYPDVGSHRRFVSAVGIDALGSGIWLPLSVLYFLCTTDVSLAHVGLALSVAAVLAMPFALVAGQLVDRLGARRTLQTGNLLQVVGFAAYLLADTPLLITVVATLTGVGRAMFWGSYAPMVTVLSEPGERERWFGFLNALRNTGFAVGGLAASVALSIRSDTAMHAVVLLNAASYLVSYALMSRVQVERSEHPSGRPGATEVSAGRWWDVVRDPGYRWLVGANLGYALGTMALNVLLPAYVVGRLGLPGWVSAAVYVINTVMIGLGQGLAVRAMTGIMRWRAIVLSATLSAVAFVAFLAAGDVTVTSLAVGLVLAALVVYTLGEMTGGPVLATLAAESPPAHLRGRYQAAYQLSWSAAGAIAPVLYLSLLGAGRWQVWSVLVAIALLGAGCCLPLRRLMPMAARPITNRAGAVAVSESGTL